MKTNQEGYNDQKAYIQFSASAAVGRCLHLKLGISLFGGKKIKFSDTYSHDSTIKKTLIELLAKR